MAQILCAEELLRKFNPVPLPDFVDRHHGEQIVPGTPQRDVPIEPDRWAGLHWQGHRDRKNMSVAQTHLLQDALEILPPHEAIERGECTGREELEIACGPL